MQKLPGNVFHANVPPLCTFQRRGERDLLNEKGKEQREERRELREEKQDVKKGK